MPKLHTLLVFLGLGSLLIAHHAAAQAPTTPTYFTEVCRSKYGNYSTNGTYESNLKSLLISLQASNGSSSDTSAGSGADMLYGQYYCRGDISTQLCGDCVKEAAQSVAINCRNFKAAVMWYEECTLRYSNQSMLGIFEDFPRSYVPSVLNVTDPEKFGVVLRDTRDRVIDKSAYGNGSLHFATGEGVVSEFETVYYLVQCSPDLSNEQCEKCLRSSYDLFTTIHPGNVASQFLIAFYASCQMRYSTQGAFYPLPNLTVSQASPTQQPSPTAAAKGKDSSYYVARAVVPAVVVGLLVLLAISFCLIKRNRLLSSKWQHPDAEVGDEESGVQNTDCIQFDLKTIEEATNSFSMSNKLGQGGFGMVYQGILKDGQDVAVKRLSKNSGQGAKEFKTEVEVVAKLQHKNLVRLVGCCVDREERLLVYEFLRNLSLDCFLYDPYKSTYLTWEVRYKVIQGIARGLHYLHEDSRVKIVHRDLKISNILLTDNLEPKIADFGLAKLVNVDQTSDNTTKVVGTYGYMSPEYALAGRYSTKSDVYSFGVIVLEILSGKINSRFYDISQGEGLLSFAWRVWNEGEIEKLMDPVLENNYSRIEAERCLQIGLLCVQDDEANRPPMHAVLVMLNSNTVDIPRPFSPSHSSYINKLSSCDETQEGISKQHQNDSSKSSLTLSATQKDLQAR